ncbi:MAG: RNA methyltransferase [Campylobacterales bacterium]|nr:RNA methyltransferase [Campylobacterales bacterium]NQY53377.1 RNA methyltransferase [Campylobacteraceae bacterium]
MINILDINDSQVSEFISLKQSSLADNLVVVESKNVLKKLFSSDIKIHKIFTNNENIDFIEDFCENIDFPIYTASNELMKKIVGHKIHQGLMALIDKPKYIEFSEIRGNVVVLNGLTSPENVGSIVRSCASFNVKNIIIDVKTCSPFIRRCIRVSTGNLFNINVYKSFDLVSDLKKLQEKDYSIITTANEEKAISLQKYSFSNNSALVIGSEGDGVQKEIFDLSNDMIKIDIEDDVTSLNAAIAASIILFQMSLVNK